MILPIFRGLFLRFYYLDLPLYRKCASLRSDFYIASIYYCLVFSIRNCLSINVISQLDDLKIYIKSKIEKNIKKKTDSTKFLRLLIDEYLTWESHKFVIERDSHIITASNSEISPDFLVSEFCGIAQFPLIFGRIAKISTPWN